MEQGAEDVLCGTMYLFRVGVRLELKFRLISQADLSRLWL